MRPRAFVALSTFLVAMSGAVDAHDVVAWQAERAAHFAALHLPAREHQAAEIAKIKARTAAILKTQVPLSQASLNRPAVLWRIPSVSSLVFDDPVAPRMVVLPAGEFTMGSPNGEPDRDRSEGPRQRARLVQPLAVSMFPVTFGEYAWFVYDTHRMPAKSCRVLEGGRLRDRLGADWEHPGFEQVARSPATCIAFNDATAYTSWLSRKTGQHYRLLNEAEYEYANRGESVSRFWFGNDAKSACRFVNGLDQSAERLWVAPSANACDDGRPFTAPLDKSKSNSFGLFDTSGNVASWTSDCWHRHLPSWASSRSHPEPGRCRAFAVRGGSWLSPARELRSASRLRRPKGYVGADVGFRIARDL